MKKKWAEDEEEVEENDDGNNWNQAKIQNWRQTMRNGEVNVIITFSISTQFNYSELLWVHMHMLPKNPF